MNQVQFFDALVGWAKAEIERGNKRRAEEARTRRQKRNAVARKRYAKRKDAGTLPIRAAKLASVEYEIADGCRCHLVKMPPCGWCENTEGADQ